MKISVIMPVYLGEYKGRANHPNQKFMRAVDSFVNQTHKDSELIIASDGCKESIRILGSAYSKYLVSGKIKLIELPRHELFTGSVRQAAINRATGDVLCNLDSDDEFMPNHLYNLNLVFNTNEYDWVYFNLYRKLDNLIGVEEVVTTTPDLDSLCTASVAWKRGLDVTWIGADGRQDNKTFNKQLLDKYPKRTKIYGAGYIVHHANFKLV